MKADIMSLSSLHLNQPCSSCEGLKLPNFYSYVPSRKIYSWVFILLSDVHQYIEADCLRTSQILMIVRSKGI